MNVKQFLVEFGHVVNAPNGLKQVRDLIIKIGVTGKLGKGNRKEESSLELVERAICLKKNLQRSKKIKPEKKLEKLKDNEFTYSPPDNWTKSKLGEILNVIRGASPRPKGDPKYFSKKGSKYHWVKISDIRKYSDGWFLKDTDEFLTEEGATKSVELERGTFILTNSATIGVPIILDIDGGCIHDGFLAFPYIDESILIKKYLYYFFLDFKADLENRAYGMAQLNINTNIIKNVPFALPPLEEQKRIVAKVDELMALCDRLEAQQQKRHKLQALTRTAALGALADAQSIHELKDSWKRVQDNLHLLLDDPASIDALQGLFAKLAVRGLLSQEPSREWVDIEEIINNTDRMRNEYLKQKWLRKQKRVENAQMDDDEYPDHWEVVAFDKIAIVIGGITKGRNLKNRQTAFYPYLRVANVQRGYFDLSEMKEIEIPVDEFEKYSLAAGDLLITEGGDWDKVGRTAIWRDQISDCLHQNHIFKARVPSELILNEWVELVFNSEVGRDYFARASKQTTNLASINMTQLRSFPFPIPPLSEQKQILNSLESAFKTCRILKNQMVRKQNLAERLSQATIATLTGTQIQEKETMKAPQTELVTRLVLMNSPNNKDQAPLSAILAKHNGELSAKVLFNYAGFEIDDFYRQLKTEMARGWIVEPEKARMVEKPAFPEGTEAG